MKKKHLFLLPLFALVLVGAFVFGFNMGEPVSNSLENSITYNSMVRYDTTGDFEGRVSPAHVGIWELIEASPNQLYDTGKEEIEDYLMEGTGAGDAFDWIELGDAAAAVGAPSAGKAEAYTAHAADGLSEAAGVAGTNAASGNWTVYHEFTSSATNQLTNISRLRNANGDDLAGNTFALVNLSSGDKLNVTWDVWVV